MTRSWRLCRRLQQLPPGTRPPLDHVVTKVLMPGVTQTSLGKERNGGEGSEKEGVELPHGGFSRYFLSTPRVTSTIRELFGCQSALGLELAAGDSDQDCMYPILV